MPVSGARRIELLLLISYSGTLGRSLWIFLVWEIFLACGGWKICLYYLCMLLNTSKTKTRHLYWQLVSTDKVSLKTTRLTHFYFSQNCVCVCYNCGMHDEYHCVTENRWHSFSVYSTFESLVQKPMTTVVQVNYRKLKWPCTFSVETLHCSLLFL